MTEVKSLKRVTLYTSDNFQGTSFEMGVGEINLNHTPVGSSKVVSLILEPYTTITLYSAYDLKAEVRSDGKPGSLTLTAGKDPLRVHNLYNPDKGWFFTNKAASIKVGGGSQLNLFMMAAGALGAYMAFN